MICGNRYIIINEPKHPRLSEILGVRFTCVELPELLLIRPVVVREPIQREELGSNDLLGWIARQYAAHHLKVQSVSKGYYNAIEVKLSEGVTLGFSFSTPTREPDAEARQNVNLQFLIREDSCKDNGLRLLRSFLDYLEYAPENPVKVVFFKYGIIDGDALGREVKTTNEDRLRRVYDRFFRPELITTTEYYRIPFCAKFPKKAEKDGRN